MDDIPDDIASIKWHNTDESVFINRVFIELCHKSNTHCFELNIATSPPGYVLSGTCWRVWPELKT